METPSSASSVKKQYSVHHYDIPVGTNLLCLFKNNARLTTKLVGYASDEFIILKFPTASGIHSYLEPQTPFAAVFEDEGQNVAFHSAITMPIPRRFLSLCEYPSVFKITAQRNDKRLDCLIPAKISAGDASFLGVIQDISVSGCKMILEGMHSSFLRKIEEGAVMHLEIWGQKDTLGIDATIMRRVQNVHRLTLGLAFSGISKNDIATIDSFIANFR